MTIGTGSALGAIDMDAPEKNFSRRNFPVNTRNQRLFARRQCQYRRLEQQRPAGRRRWSNDQPCRNDRCGIIVSRHIWTTTSPREQEAAGSSTASDGTNRLVIGSGWSSPQRMYRTIISFDEQMLDAPAFVDSDIVDCINSSRDYCSSLSRDERRAVLLSAIQAVELRMPMENDDRNDDKEVRCVIDCAIYSMEYIDSPRESCCAGVFIPMEVVKKAIAYRDEKLYMQPRKLQIISELTEPTVNAVARVPFGTNEVTVPLGEEMFRETNWSGIHAELSTLRRQLSADCKIRVEIPTGLWQPAADLYKSVLAVLLAGTNTIQLLAKEIDEVDLKKLVVIFRAVRDYYFIFNRLAQVALYSCKWSNPKLFICWKLVEIVMGTDGIAKNVLRFGGPYLLPNLLDEMKQSYF
uniref:Uncharacterized protein n=1 Tax=Trichuris muris TaxID=70415 RepID=A0A5S6QTV3_TRIMR